MLNLSPASREFFQNVRHILQVHQILLAVHDPLLYPKEWLSLQFSDTAHEPLGTPDQTAFSFHLSVHKFSPPLHHELLSSSHHKFVQFSHHCNTQALWNHTDIFPLFSSDSMFPAFPDSDVSQLRFRHSSDIRFFPVDRKFRNQSSPFWHLLSCQMVLCLVQQRIVSTESCYLQT